jgi:hypothetical protein
MNIKQTTTIQITHQDICDFLKQKGIEPKPDEVLEVEPWVHVTDNGPGQTIAVVRIITAATSSTRRGPIKPKDPTE